jgi:ABC-type sugar transport system ATPase subunit
MLAARAINKSYGGVRALVDVDFSIEPGEIVALAGENGSGKSTLAKILAGVVQPDGGELLLDGESCSFARPRDALDHGITLVAQELTAVPQLSVGENVLLSRLPKPLGRFSRRRFDALAREALARAGLAIDPRRSFSSLKPGEREFVEVAKALAAEPRYLILDEATSRFGERDVERLFALLRRLRESGVSTILITHRLKEICEIADRGVVLRDGNRVGELARDELSERRLSSMMVGRELREFFHKQRVEIGPPLLQVEALVVAGTQEPVALEVRAGEIVGLAGLVGSGRSELLETMFGVRRAQGGRLLVEGRQVALGSPRRALAAGLALVPEDRHRQGLNLVACIRENIAMGTWRLVLADRGRERRLSLEAVRRLRIHAAGIEAPVRSLSGGNQQKVVVARCLTRRPRVLLLDEPTRGIDVGAKEEVFEFVGEMVAEGVGILIVSSEMVELLGICDRILVMHEQRIVGELSRAEATEERIAFLSAGGGQALVA